MTSRAPYPVDADWPTVSLGDVTTKIGSGSTPRGGAGSYLASRQTFAFVRSQNVYDRRFDIDALAFISDDQAQRLRGVLLQPGDVLLNITGDGVTFGRAAMVDESALPACVNQHVSIVRVDRTKTVPGYVLAYLTHPAVKPYLASFSSGGSRRAITKGHIESLQLPLPPLDTQRAIAATLANLDDKIESNQRLTALIPDLIGARILRALGEDRVTVPVSALGTFTNGGAYTKGASGTGRIVIRIAELNRGPGPSTVYNDIDVPGDKTAQAGDILMSWSGSLGVYRWTREEAIINQHIFKVIPKGYPAWLVFDRLKAALDVFRAIARDKATTMGHIQRTHLESTFVELPKEAEVQELDAVLGPMWERLLLAERESLKLAALRDELLPELLSGRVRVAEDDA